MSIKKHRRSEDEEGGGLPAAVDAPPAQKKAKLVEAHEDEAVKEKKQRKAEKKERKEKEKQSGEKSEKKKKKKAEKAARKAAAESEAETAQPDVAMEDAADEAADGDAAGKDKKKSKKSKKSKGEKTDKAGKLDKTDTDTSTTATTADIDAFLKKEQVAIQDPRSATDKTKKSKDEQSLRPILAFSQLPETALTKLKPSPFAAYTTPTPIQAASWPYALDGRDLVGIAETGSGKTMAFAVPCVEALLASARPAAREATKKLPSRSQLNHKAFGGGGLGHVAQPRAVVVSPTRELAMQTHAALEPLAARVGLSSVCLFGGASKDEQRAKLRQNQGAVDIIVATPGRLKDFLGDEAIALDHVCFAVLDEADRMLDTGFEEDIRLILGQCPERGQRQTLMFTATWPTSVRGLAEGFMVEPVKVTVGSKTRAMMMVDGDGDGTGENGERVHSTELQANARIAQSVEVLDQHAKERRLLQIVKQEQRGAAKNDRILVFCLYKKEAVRVENFLQGQGVRVCSIHGNLRQDQRTRSLEAFKSGQTPVLVATDVAARGLDIPEVKLVINVTFPLTIEDYVHRIGRTGRAGKTGRAITFFTEHDKAHSGSLVNILKGANQEVPEDLLKFGTTVKKKAHGTYGNFFKDVDMSQKGTKITFD